MKRKVLALVAIAAFAAAGLITINSMAQQGPPGKPGPNSNCPNGCISGTGGCICNGMWPAEYYREHR